MRIDTLVITGFEDAFPTKRGGSRITLESLVERGLYFFWRGLDNNPFPSYADRRPDIKYDRR